MATSSTAALVIEPVSGLSGPVEDGIDAADLLQQCLDLGTRRASRT
jgi:hypothetical protein